MCPHTECLTYERASGPGVGRYKDSMDSVLPIAPDCSILSMKLGPVLLYNASYIERDLAQVIVHDYGPKILSGGRQAPEAVELPDAKKANYLECRNLENCVFLGLNQTITTDTKSIAIATPPVSPPKRSAMQGGIDRWGGKEPRAIIFTSMYYTYEIGGAHSLILCLVLSM